MQPAYVRRARGEKRVAVRLPVELSHDGFDESFEADAVDLSVGGMGLRATMLPDIGQRLRCRFQLPAVDATTTQTWCEASAEVVWASDVAHTDASSEPVGKFGVRFVSTDAAAAGLLGAFLGQPPSASIASAECVDLMFDDTGAKIEGARLVARNQNMLIVECPLSSFQAGTHGRLSTGESVRLKRVSYREGAPGKWVFELDLLSGDQAAVHELRTVRPAISEFKPVGLASSRVTRVVPVSPLTATETVRGTPMPEAARFDGGSDEALQSELPTTTDASSPRPTTTHASVTEASETIVLLNAALADDTEVARASVHTSLALPAIGVGLDELGDWGSEGLSPQFAAPPLSLDNRATDSLALLGSSPNVDDATCEDLEAPHFDAEEQDCDDSSDAMSSEAPDDEEAELAWGHSPQTSVWLTGDSDVDVPKSDWRARLASIRSSAIVTSFVLWIATVRVKVIAGWARIRVRFSGAPEQSRTLRKATGSTAKSAGLRLVAKELAARVGLLVGRLRGDSSAVGPRRVTAVVGASSPSRAPLRASVSRAAGGIAHKNAQTAPHSPDAESSPKMVALKWAVAGFGLFAIGWLASTLGASPEAVALPETAPARNVSMAEAAGSAALAQTVAGSGSNVSAAAAPSLPTSVTPTVPSSGNTAGELPSGVTQASPTSGAAADTAQTVFGGEVPNGRTLRLRMSAPIQALQGQAIPGGFNLTVQGAVSRDSAVTIAELSPAVDRAYILNGLDRADLHVRFVTDRVPPYRVEARGAELLVTIGQTTSEE